MNKSKARAAGWRKGGRSGRRCGRSWSWQSWRRGSLSRHFAPNCALLRLIEPSGLLRLLRLICGERLLMRVGVRNCAICARTRVSCTRAHARKSRNCARAQTSTAVLVTRRTRQCVRAQVHAAFDAVFHHFSTYCTLLYSSCITTIATF